MSSNKRTSKVKNGILFAVVIAFLIAIIGGTYARYSSSGRVDSAGEIAKWHVTLGEQDISSEEKTIEVNLTADEESNGNVTAGKLAPGQKLSGTFKVDPTGSEVAVDYLLSIGSVQVTGETWNEGSEVSLSKVTALLEDGTEATELTIAEGGTTYFENLTDVLNGKDVTFKIYVTWENSEDANNDADTKNGDSVTHITIPVTVVVRQHIEELYTVTFKDGETTLMATTVGEGKTATRPTDPTKENYNFSNWYSDSELTNLYDFTNAINGDTTIYAKWEPALSEVETLLGYVGNTNSNDLQLGDHINYYYGASEPIECIVLWKDAEHGIQVITADTVGSEITIGGSDFNTASESYSNAVSTLNAAAMAYVPENGMAQDGRSVGSNPLIGQKNKAEENELMTASNDPYGSEKSWMTNNGWYNALKFGDDYYLQDWNQMESLTPKITDASSRKIYWLASRELYSLKSATTVGVRCKLGYGSVFGQMIVNVSPSLKPGFSNAKNWLRPVFLLKENIPVEKLN